MSKIDWKKVAASPGYKSLKAAYAKDVQKAERDRQRGYRPLRDKAEFRKEFTRIISRAQSYSYHSGKPLEDVLSEWEEDRKSWWFGHYGNRYPKIHSCSLRPESINAMRKHYKKHWGHDPKRIRQYIADFIRLRQPKRTKKPRWEDWQHRRARRNQSL